VETVPSAANIDKADMLGMFLLIVMINQ